MQVRTVLSAIACAVVVATGCGDDDSQTASTDGTGGASGGGAHATAGNGGTTKAGGMSGGGSGSGGRDSNAMPHDDGAGTSGANAGASGNAGHGAGTTPRGDAGEDDAGTSGGGGGAPPDDSGGATFGPVHMGSYNDGPVDWAETVFHNSCAPYPSELQTSIGANLAGIDNSLNGDGSLCDACAIITTRLGKSLLVHIVTTGVSKAPGDMDLSPEAYATIHEDDPQGTPDVPRPMSWQLATCPTDGNVVLQYQTEANVWWTSLWVRSATRPITKVEVKSANHADFFALRRETNGTWNDDGGFGMGAFELRISGDGASAPISAKFDGFEAGALVDTGVQF